MDLTSLSDDDLAAHHIAVVSEQERRQRLASVTDDPLEHDGGVTEAIRAYPDN